MKRLSRFGWEYVETKTTDENYMDLAYLVARNSDAIEGHMGCVVVRSSVLLETINYPLYNELRSDVHAEAAAVALAARDGVKLGGATFYVTRAPCSQCYRLLAFAGVARIVAPTKLDEKDQNSADALGIRTLVLKDDARRRDWRQALAEQHRDQDAIDRMRERRKLERKLKRDRKAASITALL